MAFVLKLSDGTTIIDFISKDYRLVDGGLEISAPKKKQVWGGNSIYASGAQLIANTWENRTISIQFNITGSTRDELADRVTQLERLLEKARTRSIEQTGGRVELQYQWEGASQMTYFEVIDGTLTFPPNTMSVEQVHQRTEENRFVIYSFELDLTCAPFAYSVSPVSGVLSPVPLSNGNGTGVTNGLKVWNHEDSHAGHDDWVEVAAVSIDGEVPARVVLNLVGDSGEAERTGKIYIGVRKGDKNFKHILEDNAAEYRIGGANPVSDADYSSGGTWTPLSFSGSSEQTLIRWALTDAETESTQGPFRFFGRCKAGSHWSNQANYRIRILYGSNSLYESEWRKPVDTITELLDFGTIFLPPWLVGTTTSLAGLKIEIQVKGDATDTQATINLDYLALLPQDGGYRVLQYRAQGLPQFETLVDDGWNDAVYHVNQSGKRTGLPFGMMPRIELVPNTTHRLYFLQEGTSKNCEITRQLRVKLYLVPVFNVLA